MIPSSVNAIYSGAFSDCSGLKSVTSLNTTPPELENNVFFGLAFICIIVLIGSTLVNHSFDKTNKVKDTSSDDTSAVEEKRAIDDNYLFVGDFYTDKFNFDDLDYHYVKSVDKDLTTEKLLNDLDKKIVNLNALLNQKMYLF